jgi:hypothetical protein
MNSRERKGEERRGKEGCYTESEVGASTPTIGSLELPAT